MPLLPILTVTDSVARVSIRVMTGDLSDAYSGLVGGSVRSGGRDDGVLTHLLAKELEQEHPVGRENPAFSGRQQRPVSRISRGSGGPHAGLCFRDHQAWPLETQASQPLSPETTG